MVAFWTAQFSFLQASKLLVLPQICTCWTIQNFRETICTNVTTIGTLQISCKKQGEADLAIDLNALQAV